MGRRQPRGMQTRERILGAALAEFARRGFAEVSIEDIAEAAGVTKGAIYHWFADKNDLGRDLQHELYDRLTTHALQTFDPNADIVTNMLRAFDVYLDALGSSGEARFFLRDAWTIPALEEGGRRDHKDAVALVRDILAAAIDAGQIVPLDPDALARVLLGAWEEATLHVLTTGQRDATVAVIEHLIESLHGDPVPVAVPAPRATPSRRAGPKV